MTTATIGIIGDDFLAGAVGPAAGVDAGPAGAAGFGAAVGAGAGAGLGAAPPAGVCGGVGC
jgi:hypothetical protein